MRDGATPPARPSSRPRRPDGTFRRVASSPLASYRSRLRRSRAQLGALLVDRRPHRYVRAALSAALIDRPMGLDTARVVSKKRLGLNREEEVHYEPSAWGSLRRILPPADSLRHDVFMDIGSGKGRVLCEAARYPFKRVIGVEISEQLNDVARLNLAARRHRLRAPVELHTADATNYEIPADVTVAYLYNPFVGGLFEDTIDNLVASVDAHPRTVRVVCRALGPQEEDLLRATGRFQLEKEALAPRPSRRWAHRAGLRRYVLQPQQLQ